MVTCNYGFLNLGFLIYYKYANFFVDNLNQFLSLFGINGWNLAPILLPIGISFFTFQSLTYAVDVYRGIHKPLALHQQGLILSFISDFNI